MLTVFGVSTALGMIPAMAVASQTALVGCDFDSDGLADLPIGVPGENLSGVRDAGGFAVLYGSASGPDTTSTQSWHQDSAYIKGRAEEGDRLGAAFACGDFDGDGWDDLAVGAPGEATSGGVQGAGAVNVFFGSASGLTDRDQMITQATNGVIGKATDFDAFGASLAAGDFDADGYMDLAVGAPGDDSGTRSGGAVNVLYGTPTGLAGSVQLWTQASADIASNPEWGDRFGAALGVADFNGDGYPDLAIGSPGEGIGPRASAGAVVTIHGSDAGLTAETAGFWHQDVDGVRGKSEAFDEYGAALAAADFDGDGYGDLAVGVPGENLVVAADAGLVSVLFGTASGLSPARDQIWHQDRDYVKGHAGTGDRFGQDLVAADFDGDGHIDLAVAIPGEKVGSASNAGAVSVFFSSAAGLTDRDVLLTADEGAVSHATNQAFGTSLGVGDFDGNSHADLVVGVPRARVSGSSGGGLAAVFSGVSAGSFSGTAMVISQDTAGVPGSPESGDGFGAVGTADLSSPPTMETIVHRPSLHIGSTGSAVSDLQGMLTQRGFLREPANGTYNEATGAAVMAFHKTLGRSWVTSWSTSDWQRLEAYDGPDLPDRDEPTRIEVDLTRQVLYLIEENQVTAITPISSGKASTPTPRGDFTYLRKIDGWRIAPLGALYRPWYFKGGFAVHGSGSVPAYPASHGCVRIELWEADDLAERFFIGVPVHV